GEYSLTITAKATQGSITGSGVKNITLNVYKRKETTDASNLDSMTTEEKNAIETLALSDNPNNKITDLSQIDFTDFTSLNTLDLSGLKNLEQADLSQLPENVKEVSLQNTNITSLNLNNSKVERVNAAGCKNLTNIEAENNDSLTELDVSESSIIKINVKNCVNLQVLNCSSCDLEAGYLNLEGCINLVSLDISKNHFGWFDYNESDLDSFECYSQDITGWESRKTFSFTKFFNSGDVTAAGVRVMASAFVNNVYDVSGYTESGDEIPSEYDSQTGVITFESAPAVIKYFYDTGFDNLSMDVTIHASSYKDEDEFNYLGSSGGCNSGLTFSSLIFAVFVFMFTKRR
ncbi:MAG: leucine-rich repeat domain-containing protein, partial [Synergistaceae bacterium]|nr:leucine-rich repeat domain-containing protein [Synergistaceae bacterium]